MVLSAVAAATPSSSSTLSSASTSLSASASSETSSPIASTSAFTLESSSSSSTASATATRSLIGPIPGSTLAGVSRTPVAHHLSAGDIAGISIGSVVGGPLLLVLAVVVYRRRTRAQSRTSTPTSESPAVRATRPPRSQADSAPNAVTQSGAVPDPFSTSRVRLTSSESALPETAPRVSYNPPRMSEDLDYEWEQGPTSVPHTPIRHLHSAMIDRNSEGVRGVRDTMIRGEDGEWR